MRLGVDQGSALYKYLEVTLYNMKQKKINSKLKLIISKLNKDSIQHIFSTLKTISKLSIHELRHSIYRLNWRGSFPDPYRIIYADSSNINYYLQRNNKISNYGTYIEGGDWDNNYYEGSEQVWNTNPISPTETFSKPTQIKFEDFDMYSSLKKHFQDSVPWKETEYYKKLKSEGNKQNPVYPTSRPTDYFDRLDSLYKSIKKYGCKSQKELLNEGLTDNQKIRILKPELNEICISIGRNGNMMHDGGGEHRLCIAKILDLEKIPVRVIVRHEEWQKYRKKIFDSSRNKTSRLNHPDLQDVI